MKLVFDEWPEGEYMSFDDDGPHTPMAGWVRLVYDEGDGIPGAVYSRRDLPRAVFEHDSPSIHGWYLFAVDSSCPGWQAATEYIIKAVRFYEDMKWLDEEHEWEQMDAEVELDARQYKKVEARE